MLVFVFVAACGDDDAATTIAAPGTTDATDECPVSCSADSEGWSVSFECEAPGQTVQ